jgi:protein-tyrosine phosphatase
MRLFRKKFTIMVVCKANITRSAYLHGYMEHYLKTQMPYARKKIHIISSGVKARRGSSAHQVTQHVAKTNHFSIQSHQSDPLTRKTVKQADVILVMEQWQKDDIIKRFPKAKEKTFRIMEYLWNGDSDEIHDVPDPTGQNTADYQEFIHLAHSETDRILRELVSRNII